MSAKDKAMELVDTYRIMLMNSDTECGEEILCTGIAKRCALIAVDEIIRNSFPGVIRSHWEEVKQEIQLL
jgi:hypothetical protein